MYYSLTGSGGQTMSRSQVGHSHFPGLSLPSQLTVSSVASRVMPLKFTFPLSGVFHDDSEDTSSTWPSTGRSSEVDEQDGGEVIAWGEGCLGEMTSPSSSFPASCCLISSLQL